MGRRVIVVIRVIRVITVITVIWDIRVIRAIRVIRHRVIQITAGDTKVKLHITGCACTHAGNLADELLRIIRVYYIQICI
jgi:hypothetical protein